MSTYRGPHQHELRPDGFCPPYCDGDRGQWCGGGDAHKPWPDGVPFEGETIRGLDGSTIHVASTRRPGGPIDVSVIVRPPDAAPVVVPLDECEAERLGDAAWTVSAWSHRGGDI